MNDKERDLLRLVCDGDIRKSQQQARIILSTMNSKKDEQFSKNMLRKLDAKQSNLIELPHNMRELLIAEDATNFPQNRFVLRLEESKTVKRVEATLNAANKLSELGISYTPTLLLYGHSGTGKTMLARYIAHRTELPFVYVRFSNIVSSYLGNTQSNIAKVFEYARTAPCVLCFDEIDAVGMARGQRNDVGEMNRIVIALMQELDNLPNNAIVIGTTNRHDRLDDALLRRFTIHHEVMALDKDSITNLAESFFKHAGYDTTNWVNVWCEFSFSEAESASTVVSKCTEKLVDDMLLKAEAPYDNTR